MDVYIHLCTYALLLLLQNHTITECLRLNSTSRDHLVQSSCFSRDTELLLVLSTFIIHIPVKFQ